MNLWNDLETYSTVPIGNGAWAYAEKAEVMLWAYAIDDGPVSVWDLCSWTVHRYDDLTDEWAEEGLALGLLPADLDAAIADEDCLMWFHNGGPFDFVVLQHALPEILARITQDRWRDTMVQALSHALPGSLDKLGHVLKIDENERKDNEGRRLVLKFCKPNAKGQRATRETDPDGWLAFVRYAARDITAMRRAHQIMPMWNYRPRDIALWHLDLRTNARGFAVDLDLAHAAVKLAGETQAGLATDVQDLTGGAVQSATQRDALLRHLLAAHGVDLPDLRADTLERRLDDPDLPDRVKDLLRIRLQASLNSVSKFKTLLRSVGSDGRLHGCMQFRGAGRTGRAAHRLFQPGNLPRPTMSHGLTDAAITALKAGYLDLVVDKPLTAISGCVRGAIVAGPGKKLVVADLANIEGRMAAWLAGEDWKLAAFRAFDAGTGPDLYALSYARAFNTTPEAVMENKKHGDGLMRQIGKVMELMLQYEGGVSAFLTGAATYSIDLDAMAEAAWGTLPEDVVNEARGFLDWLERGIPEDVRADSARFEAAKLKVRHGLAEKTFLACDCIKRLWRRAHPAISSFWKGDFDNPGLSITVERAINQPGVTFQCRRLKVRVDGSWLRIGLPSGRALCYPNIRLKGDTITYTGFNQYTKQWGVVSTYGGKLFENVTQAAAADILFEAMPAIEAEGYLPVLHVHDENVTETPDTEDFTAARLCELMCMARPWADGLPLAAAGFETYRYRKD